MPHSLSVQEAAHKGHQGHVLATGELIGKFSTWEGWRAVRSQLTNQLKKAALALKFWFFDPVPNLNHLKLIGR
jgi:hypothetical protein